MSKNKLQKKQIGRIVGWGSVGLLGMLGLTLLYPIQPSLANATLPELTIGQSSDTIATDTTVFVQSVISLALDSRVDVDIIPKASGSFSSSSAKLAIATNNTSGYGIYMNTLTGNQDLTLAGSSTNASISPVVGSVASDSFPANTWGYKLTQSGSSDTDLYQAVPGTTTKIQNITSTSTTASQDTFDLSFGAAVDTSLPAGAYNNQVVVSVVANPREIQNLTEAIYLQDFDGTRNANGTTATSSKICEQSTVGMTKQLIDTRDGKKYWVAKLADNNCWMVQNLALDLVKDKVYTSADTDLTANWSVPTTTSPVVPAPVAEPSQTGTMSWNMGNYVLATPQKGVTCNSAPAGGSTNNDGYNSLRPGQTFATQCPDFQLVDDAWTDAGGDGGAYNVHGTWKGYNGLVVIDEENKKYDGHYLIGNYYQWNAATTGTGGEIINTNAVSSICPKGWHLPMAGRTAAGIPIGNDDSFAKLLAAYGYPQPDQSTGWTLTNSNGYTSITTAGATRLDGAPMYFVRSGVVNLFAGSLRSAGTYGYYWSSAAYSTATNAYNLNFDASSVYPSNNTNRYIGLPVRCVAR